MVEPPTAAEAAEIKRLVEEGDPAEFGCMVAIGGILCWGFACTGYAQMPSGFWVTRVAGAMDGDCL